MPCHEPQRRPDTPRLTQFPFCQAANLVEKRRVDSVLQSLLPHLKKKLFPDACIQKRPPIISVQFDTFSQGAHDVISTQMKEWEDTGGLKTPAPVSISSYFPLGDPFQYSWASLVTQLVKNPPAMRETWVRSLSWEDTLEKGTATHSSILAWRIPWTEEPGRLQSIALQRVKHA